MIEPSPDLSHSPLTIHLVVESQDDRWNSHLFWIEKQFTELAEKTLRHCRPKLTGDVELSCILVNDQIIQVLNKTYREKDKPTNVLSFESGQLDQEFLLQTPLLLLGDIVLSYDTIARESVSGSKSFENHLSHLFVHGLLHLLGYDHEVPEDAELMESLEVEILQIFNIDNPYTDLDGN